MWYADALIGTTVCGVMLYGAIWDGRKRIIPDLVPVALGVLGIITIFIPEISIWHLPLSVRMAGFALPTAALLILHLLGKPVGGGDFKLSAALGFLFGIYQFAVIYAVGGFLALIWAAAKKKKSVPLAVFLFVGVVACLLL